MKRYYNTNRQIINIGSRQPITRKDGGIEINPSALTDKELYEACGLYRYEFDQPDSDEEQGEIVFDDATGTCRHKRIKRDLETVRTQRLEELEMMLDDACARLSKDEKKAAIKGEKVTSKESAISTTYSKLKKNIEGAATVKELITLNIEL